MTVKELRKRLLDFDEDDEVFLEQEDWYSLELVDVRECKEGVELTLTSKESWVEDD